MSSVNKVTLIGRLAADPEIRSFSNGGQIANLRLATSESWKDKQTGEKKERTEWHSVSVQNIGTVGFIGQYVKKGDLVYVEGKLQTRKWQDRNGNDRYSTEVVVSAFGGDVQKLNWDKREQSDGGYSAPKQSAPAFDDFDDSVPF